ncbi:hypothetical protein RCO48_22085 [Peribacillus frigoritolerans]|nr:hypothetical protein [Peribacillus frigoritolerans]
MEFVVSNTTEAGIKYQPILLEEGKPMESFPGKLTAFFVSSLFAFQWRCEKRIDHASM